MPDLPMEAAAQLAASGQSIPESGAGARAMKTPPAPRSMIASPEEADTFDGVDLLSDTISDKTPQRTPGGGGGGGKLYAGGEGKLYAGGGGDTPV